VYICDITAFVLVRYRIAARPNSELRQKSLGLGLDLEIKSLALVWLKSLGLGLGLGLDKKVLFTRLSGTGCFIAVPGNSKRQRFNK